MSVPADGAAIDVTRKPCTVQDSTDAFFEYAKEATLNMAVGAEIGAGSDGLRAVPEIVALIQQGAVEEQQRQCNRVEQLQKLSNDLCAEYGVVDDV